jgi:hypoxanthine phosphoribosyltransferase
MHKDLEKILLTREEIAARVRELGAQITADYEGRSILLVCILKGAVTFFSDLAREIKVPAEFDFMVCSSYGDATDSSGFVKIRKDLDCDAANKDVLIVEDIIDTGTTLSRLKPILEDRGAKSVKIATILNKPSRRKANVTVDYNGFEIPDAFVVGYGLDYAGRYRNIPYIGILKESVYKARIL